MFFKLLDVVSEYVTQVRVLTVLENVNRRMEAIYSPE